MLWHSLFLTPDDFAAISSGLVGAAVVLVLSLTQRYRGRKRILITDYRCGLRFINGEFASILPPGSYRYNPQSEQITVIDMRPQPMLLERQVFQDVVGAQAVISIGTELVVNDPRLVATALRDQIKDSFVIVRDTVRSAASRQVVAGLGDNRKSIAVSLLQAVNSELAKVGMRVPEVEITELWASTPVMQQGSASGVVQ